MELLTLGMGRLLFTLVLLCVIGNAFQQSAPTHCSYVEDTLFTCDYSAMTSSANRPISFTSFNPQPQRLEVIVDGLIPYFGDSQMFSSEFGGINTADFDGNYPASVTIDCEGHDTMLFTGAFANMSHVQTFKMTDCGVVYIPVSAFEDFGNLDSLRFERGFIDTADVNAWKGLNIEKLTYNSHSIPRNLGSFEILYTKFTSATVPIGMLFNMKNLTSATIRGAGIDTLTTDVFGYNAKLKMIDISDNVFTSLPNGLFDNLNALAEVRTQNIPWQCTCDSIWFVLYMTENNITLIGDNICANTNGQTIFKYYWENCVESDPCDGIACFPMGSKCVTILAVIVTVLAFAALTMVIVALVTLVTTVREYRQKDMKRRQAIGRWNQVIERTVALTKQ